MKDVKVIIHSEETEETLFSFLSCEQLTYYVMLQSLIIGDEIILPTGLRVSIFGKQFCMMTNVLKISVIIMGNKKMEEPHAAPEV